MLQRFNLFFCAKKGEHEKCSHVTRGINLKRLKKYYVQTAYINVK